LRKKTPWRRRMLGTSERAVEAEERMEEGEDMGRCWRTEITPS
jgi:hypothetical protein